MRTRGSDRKRKRGEIERSELDQLLNKFVSKHLEIFQQKLQEKLEQKNHQITEVTRTLRELELKSRQQEEAIKKTETERDDLERIKAKEVEIISVMYKERIRDLEDDLEEKNNLIQDLKTKNSSKNDTLVRKLKLKLSRRKEKNGKKVRKLKELNNDLINIVKVEKSKLKSAEDDIKEKNSKIEQLMEAASGQFEKHKTLYEENEALKSEVDGLLSEKEDIEDLEIKNNMLVEKDNSNINLIKEMSLRNKTLMGEISRLKDECKSIQLMHDCEAHSNFQKKDQIEGLEALNRTLQDQQQNRDNELKETKEEMEKLRVNLTECQNSLKEIDLMKLEISRNDLICEENENLRNDLRKFAEEKSETEELICKLKDTMKTKGKELEDLRKKIRDFISEDSVRTEVRNERKDLNRRNKNFKVPKSIDFNIIID